MKKRENIDIIIKYSLKYEAIQVDSTLRSLKWIKKNYPFFPLNLPKCTNSNNPPTIKNYLDGIKEEYDNKYYIDLSKKITKKWESVSPKIFSQLKKIGLDVEKKYVIILTSYGIGGSYDTPNLIVVNSRIYTVNSLINVIIHELIHICIESLVKKYRIESKEKEVLVDLIIQKQLPNFNNEPNKKIEYEFKEKFDKYFPDIVAIIHSIKNREKIKI